MAAHAITQRPRAFFSFPRAARRVGSDRLTVRAYISSRPSPTVAEVKIQPALARPRGGQGLGRGSERRPVHARQPLGRAASGSRAGGPWRPSLSRERSRPLVAVLRPPRSQWGATGRAPPRADRGGKRRGSRAALPSCRGRSPAARLSSFPGCSAFRFSPASVPFALSVDTRRTERGQRAWTRESLRAH